MVVTPTDSTTEPGTGTPTGTQESALATTELALGGMHCSACATRIQRTLVKVPAVASAAVNLATNQAFVSYDPAGASVDDLCQAVDGAGYTAVPVDEAPVRAVGEDPDHWGLRAALSWPLAIVALLVAVLSPETAVAGWSVLVLGIAVELAGGWPFLRDAARLLRHGATSMDTLIALGTLAALSVSAVEAIALGGRHLHLGGSGAFAARLHGVMAPLIVAILVSGRAVEARARARAAGAAHSLLSLRPPTARVVAGPDDEVGELVPPETVPVGALVRVRPDEAVPLDGTVTAGWSPVDESMLTGEPLPVDRGPGDQATGGTRNGSGALVVRVDAPATESVLARLQRLVEEAQRDKAPLQRVADRISGVFVPAVLLGSAATFLAWWLVVGDLGQAVLSGLAVLLVACPCAMGLAAPVAMMVGSGRAAALGIFVRGGDVLERLAKVDEAVFDKTGTLTERHAEVTLALGTPDTPAGEVVALAAAVESESDHPIAIAIRGAAAGNEAPAGGTEAPAGGTGGSGTDEAGAGTAVDVRSLAGVGVTGTVGGHRVTVVRMEEDRLPEDLRAAAVARSDRGETVVMVERDDLVVGAIAVTTPLRPEARSAVDHLAGMGLPSAILSGDSAPAVDTVAATLGISSARSHLSPEGKLAALDAWREEGRRIVMVGDGVNDAPALAAAYVGCAVGSGSEAALANSDVALLGNDLEGVPAAVGVARSTYAVIIQNFGWAMGYNVAALPLAAVGLLDPLIAAIAMGLSSVIVVLNSLRLTRLGRSGAADVSAPRVLHGRRGVMASVLLPVALFAALTGVSQALSPARGQPLLPTLPSITTTVLPRGGSMETYLEPGGAGVNQFHLIVTGATADVDSVAPHVVLTRAGGGSPQVLRPFKLGAGHFSAVVVLTQGTWHAAITTPFGPRGDRATAAVTFVVHWAPSVHPPVRHRRAEQG